MEHQKPKESVEPDAVRRAIESGVDVTLLIENLKLTPTERLRKAQRMLDSVVAFQSEIRSCRARRNET